MSFGKNLQFLRQLKGNMTQEGEFISNIETTGFDYFGIDELPCLAEEKNNKEQIEMCFKAMHSKIWESLYD